MADVPADEMTRADVYRERAQASERALEAAREVARCSYEAHMAREKPEEQWDEYDTMIIPLWRALDAALDEAPGA